MMQAMQGLATGMEVDGYRIEGVLGRGGMGIVYRAEDVALSRPVALKVIDPALANDEAFIRRFRAEARALARIHSPHIVGIHALRRTDAGMFIVMEFVDGGTLSDRLAEGPMPWTEARPIVRRMLMALEQAHGVGVIHRDIKPGNIMLCQDGTVKVTDFGLAKLHEGDRAATVTQGVAGTLYYMSPEQVRGRHNLDHRSDLYALGMTLYEMLAGRLPFDRDAGDFAIMRAIVEQELPPPTRFRPDVPEAVSDVIMRALEKDPDRRYPDARAMLESLDTAVDEAPTPSNTATDRLPVPRRGARLFALAVVLAVVATGSYFLLRGQAAPGVSGAAGLPTTGGALPAGQTLAESPVQPFMVDGELVAEYVLDPPPAAVATEPAPRPGPGVRADGASATAAPEAPATLALESADEGVRVTVGGQTRAAPARFELAAGTHEVVFEHPEHGRRSERLTVAAGARESLTYHFTGRVSVPSPLYEDGRDGPWATIWVDGETHEGWFTPKTIALGPGTHTVSLTKTGFEILDNGQEVTITPGFRMDRHSLTFGIRRP